MKRQVISEAIGNIDGKYIVEATEFKAESKMIRHNTWKKITAVAACFILVSVLGAALFQSGLFDDDGKIETPDGNVIEFHETFQYPVLIREQLWRFLPKLTDDELKLLFNDLPVSAYGNSSVILGELYDTHFEIYHSNTMFQYVFDEEAAVDINGVSVTAKCYRFVDAQNQKKIIYYAAFELGGKYYYLGECVSANNIAMKKARKNVANAIEALINNGEIDFSEVKR